MAEGLILSLYLLFWGFLVALSPWFRLPGFKGIWGVALLLLKFLAGMGIAWIYTHYYGDRNTADVFKLFDDSKHIYEALENNPADYWRMISGMDGNAPYYDVYYNRMNNWFYNYDLNPSFFNDTRTIIRVHAFLRIFSFGYYSVHVLFWSVFSLLGTTMILRALRPLTNINRWLLLIAFFAIPSVLAWGSGLLKEGLLLLFLGALLLGFFKHLREGLSLRGMLLFGFGLAGFLVLKVHVFLALLPALAGCVLAARFPRLNIKWSFGGVLVGFTLLFALFSLIFPSIDLLRWMAERQQAMLRLGYYTDSGSLLFVNPLDGTWISVLRNLPEALISAFFRPWVTEAEGALQWMAALENLALALLIIPAILFRKSCNRNQQMLVAFCFSFTLVLFAFMGLTTPVLGTLVRYRMPALSFFVFGLMQMTDYKAFYAQLKIWFRYDD